MLAVWNFFGSICFVLCQLFCFVLDECVFLFVFVLVLVAEIEILFVFAVGIALLWPIVRTLLVCWK